MRPGVKVTREIAIFRSTDLLRRWRFSMSSQVFKHLSVKDVNGVAVVDFVNSSLMFATEVVEEIGDELNNLLKSHASTKILLDFSHVQYLSSTMLAKLARLEQQVGQVKGHLKLCGLGPVLMDTFRIGHFDRVFSIYDDAESALRAFS
jgi:anti-sigma B factor antagonist